jgi:hypothetical protein
MQESKTQDKKSLSEEMEDTILRYCEVHRINLELHWTGHHTKHPRSMFSALEPN